MRNRKLLGTAVLQGRVSVFFAVALSLGLAGCGAIGPGEEEWQATVRVEDVYIEPLEHCYIAQSGWPSIRIQNESGPADVAMEIGLLHEDGRVIEVASGTWSIRGHAGVEITDLDWPVPRGGPVECYFRNVDVTPRD